VLVDDLVVDAPKTRDLLGKLEPLGLASTLIVVDQLERNLALAARNLPSVRVTDVSGLDIVSLIRFDRLVMTKAALERIEAWLA
jgi:large subunit ribosomal protein L4